MDDVAVGLVVMVLFAMDWRLAMVALCIAPVWVTFMRYFSPRIKAVSHRMQETLETISGEVQERVAGATTIKSFGREDHEVSQFRVRSEHLCERTIDKVKLAPRQTIPTHFLPRSPPTTSP